jgi:hypothetical protein
MGTGAFSNYDKKYEQGEIAEARLDAMFKGKVAFEIKSDQKWIDTGNIFVEVRGFKASKGGWVPSGIYDPDLEVEIFAYEFSGFWIWGPPEAWKYAVETQGVRVPGGDESNPTEGVLLTLTNIGIAFREWAKDNNDN